MLCVRACVCVVCVCVCRYIPAMSEKDFIVGTTSLKVTPFLLLWDHVAQVRHVPR